MHGVPVLAETWEEQNTSEIEDPDARHAARGQKSDRARIERLEERVDGVTVSLARLEGKTDGQTAIIERIDKSIDRMASRDDIVFTSKVEVHKAKEIDKVKAGADKRERITKIMGGLASGGLIVEVLHRLGVL